MISIIELKFEKVGWEDIKFKGWHVLLRFSNYNSFISKVSNFWIEKWDRCSEKILLCIIKIQLRCGLDNIWGKQKYIWPARYLIF